MSTRTGFPRMDWDTGFLADPKFQHLRDLVADPIRFGYAGFSYLRLCADAWRTTQRHPIQDVVRGVESWAVDALIEAGLLDPQGRVTEESFDKWVGTAVEARREWRDRQRSHRESRAVTVTNGESPPARAMYRDDRVGTIGTVGREPRARVDRNALHQAAEVAGGLVATFARKEPA